EVVGPRRVAQQGSNLVARLRHLAQQVAVLRISAGLEGFEELAARSVALYELHNRQDVGVIGGDADGAVAGGLVAADVIPRQALKTGSAGQGDHPLLARDI